MSPKEVAERLEALTALYARPGAFVVESAKRRRTTGKESFADRKRSVQFLKLRIGKTILFVENICNTENPADSKRSFI